ncbi:sugar ABC transporter ATP-binding protein [Gephyromycinifex aptenodytis]|uniref:sugar ABC transporter ATP-binding protein n=1 Tax=Gephyromycinifex aptenodytis TaxID=2716227 RepID=UPI00144563F3|nr:sugar ABC transporter ATP-binding protein [Gephyromycinifex aptenodytis]
MSEHIPLLRVRSVSKVFGATSALQDITLDVEAGTIHSLLGRNGAGKSTLVNIIAGIYPPTEGEVLFDGKDIRQLNIFERQERGIRLVPQHENSFPLLTVAENIFVGVLPRKNGFVDWKQVHARAAEELARYGLHVNPSALVSEISSIDARKLNIIRAMQGGAKLIILDEPTTALTNREREELFEFVDALKRTGTAFIFISHYLSEVLQLSDGITVLRDGNMFPVENLATVSEVDLANLVAGHDVELLHRTPMSAEAGEVLMRVQNLCAPDVQDVSLDIRKGEVIGIVGFPRSGAREFCRTLFGLERIESGTLELDGRRLRLSSPRDALDQGIAYISFDRHREGVIPVFDVNENLTISIVPTVLKRPFGFLDRGKQRAVSMSLRDELNIKSNSIFAPIDSLSGGNQQKVIVARLLAAEPRLVILDEPTIGIDIKSREEIITKVDQLTKNDLSALYLTNDYEELLRVADRLAIFDHGRLVMLLDNTPELTIEKLTELRDQAKEEVHP